MYINVDKWCRDMTQLRILNGIETQQALQSALIRFEGVFKMNSGLQDDGVANGVYQQQLKNALLGGLKPEMCDWVRKHDVGLPLQSMEKFTTFAHHAESAVKRKAKLLRKLKVFWQEDDASEEEMYYCGARGNHRGRSRGHGRSFRKSFRGGHKRNEERHERTKVLELWKRRTLSMQLQGYEQVK